MNFVFDISFACVCVHVTCMCVCIKSCFLENQAVNRRILLICHKYLNENMIVIVCHCWLSKSAIQKTLGRINGDWSRLDGGRSKWIMGFFSLPAFSRLLLGIRDSQRVQNTRPPKSCGSRTAGDLLVMF